MRESQVELQWGLMLVGAFEVGLGDDLDAGRRCLHRALELARSGALLIGVPWLLEFAAQAATKCGRMDEAAQLFGAADALFDRFDIAARWEPLRSGDAEARTAVERSLGDRYEAAQSIGTGLSIGSAVDLAVEAVTVDAPF